MLLIIIVSIHQINILSEQAIHLQVTAIHL